MRKRIAFVCVMCRLALIECESMVLLCMVVRLPGRRLHQWAEQKPISYTQKNRVVDLYISVRFRGSPAICRRCVFDIDRCPVGAERKNCQPQPITYAIDEPFQQQHSTTTKRP